MDLAIEANRNSALFNTMQQVLDVYNPLMHKARPTVVNQTKHRIRVQPNSWGNTMQSWSGSRTARFDMPRIGSLVDASLKVAFKIPGNEPTTSQRKLYGNRGLAKTSLTTGGLVNTDSDTLNTARGRLDRIYADRLLGFNMISSYVVSSKSRQIFSGTGEYLLIRFSQLDSDQKEAIFRSISPVDIMASGVEDMFYAPAVSYQMTIPLYMFFNEHITNALDVNFSEEVHIDITFRSPSELFWYGNLGDLNYVPTLKAATKIGSLQTQPGGVIGTDSGVNAWDQSTTAGARNHTGTELFTRALNTTGTATTIGTKPFGTANVGTLATDTDVINTGIVPTVQSSALTLAAQRHIQGVGAPWDSPSRVTAVSNYYSSSYYGNAGYVKSGPTFAYKDVDNNGDSVQIQFEMIADYIVQDTDAYRALRAQMFPEGTGLTEIVYDISTERYSNLFASASDSGNLLDIKSGGAFVDPAANVTGLTVGDSTRFVDLQLRNNNLCFATHFMVRKHSDMGGDNNAVASTTVGTYGKYITTGNKVLGAHNISTRLLPVHYFQLLAAGRVIYESDGDSHLNLTQSSMYAGTGKEWGMAGTDTAGPANAVTDTSRTNARPFNVYSIPFGLQSSRLENTGCLSYQNLNNPTLRIYFKPEAWNEHQVEQNSGSSEAINAAALGVQVDVVHEFFNVVTINSGNGEITSGLNQ
jgi:hypothetical protein